MNERTQTLIAWAVFVAVVLGAIAAASGFYLWEFLAHVGDEAL